MNKQEINNFEILSTLETVSSHMFLQKTDVMLFSVTYVQTFLTIAAKPVFQLILLATFLHFFGLPAVETYGKKEVMVVEKRRNTDGISFPTITIAAIGQQEPENCYKLSDGGSVEKCIEESSLNSSDLLKGVMLGFEGSGLHSVSFNVTGEVLSEDSTQHFSGKHYTLTLPLRIGPDSEEDQVYLLLSKELKFPYQIFLHDPKFFIFSDNPVAFPMEVRLFKTESSSSHCHRINLVQMNELNVPSDPCNTDPDFNFWACVKESVSAKVFPKRENPADYHSCFSRLDVAPSGTPRPKNHAQAANNSGENPKQASSSFYLKRSLSGTVKDCSTR